MIERIGKYRILGRIASGGMGSVYRAHDPLLEREVALKVISAGAEVGDELRARFFLEGQACARLSHPNIVTVYDLGEADGHLFIVMEMLEGEELRQIIARRGPLHLRDKLSLIIQLCDGLDYAHGKGIVHRDVKPANLLVLPTGQLKILDFGIARIEAAKTALTRTGLLIGTLQYMAPERLRGHGDHRADVFSTGAVLYELLTYRSPFRGEDPLQILEEVRTADPPAPSTIDAALPAELDAIVARALDKDATRRFDTLRAMRAELQGVGKKADELAERAAADVRSELDAVARLEQSLALRIGGAEPSGAPAGVDAQMPLAALEAVRADALARRDVLQRLLAQADSLAPDFARALHALEGEDLPAAVVSLERVVAAMPEHLRAVATLDDVRRRIEERHRLEEVDASAPEAIGDDRGPAPVNTASEVTIEKSSLDPDATVVADVKALTGSRETVAPVAEIVTPPTAPPPPPSPATPRRIQAGRHAGKIVVAASLAAITAGALWFLQSRPQRPEETTAAIRATPTATGRSSPKAALDERTEGPAASADAPAAAVAVAIVPPAAPPTSGSQPRSAGPDAPIDPRSEVRTSLSRYVRAIETKDLVLLRRVRPGLTDDETRRWARSFEITRSRKVDLQLHEISVDSDQARAVGRRADVVVMHDGRRVQTQTRFVCTLRRGHEGWVIEDFQETGPRS